MLLHLVEKECPEKFELLKPYLSSASFSLFGNVEYVSALRVLPSKYVKAGSALCPGLR